MYNVVMETQASETRTTETVTVRVPRALYLALVAEAKREDRSIAAQLRRVLAERYGEDGEDRSIAAQLRRVLAERYGEDGEGPER